MDPNFYHAFVAWFLALCSVGGAATLTFYATKNLTYTNFNVSHGDSRCPLSLPPRSQVPLTLATLEHKVPPTLTTLMPKPEK